MAKITLHLAHHPTRVTFMDCQVEELATPEMLLSIVQRALLFAPNSPMKQFTKMFYAIELKSNTRYFEFTPDDMKDTLGSLGIKDQSTIYLEGKFDDRSAAGEDAGNKTPRAGNQPTLSDTQLKQLLASNDKLVAVVLALEKRITSLEEKILQNTKQQSDQNADVTRQLRCIREDLRDVKEVMPKKYDAEEPPRQPEQQDMGNLHSALYGKDFSPILSGGSKNEDDCEADVQGSNDVNYNSPKPQISQKQELQEAQCDTYKAPIEEDVASVGSAYASHHMRQSRAKEHVKAMDDDQEYGIKKASVTKSSVGNRGEQQHSNQNSVSVREADTIRGYNVAAADKKPNAKDPPDNHRYNDYPAIRYGYEAGGYYPRPSPEGYGGYGYVPSGAEYGVPKPSSKEKRPYEGLEGPEYNYPDYTHDEGNNNFGKQPPKALDRKAENKEIGNEKPTAVVDEAELRRREDDLVAAIALATHLDELEAKAAREEQGGKKAKKPQALAAPDPANNNGYYQPREREECDCFGASSGFHRRDCPLYH